MDKHPAATFFWFIVAFIAVSIPLVGLTADFYPLSRFHMFSDSVLPACGLLLFDQTGQPIHLGSPRKFLNLLDYSQRSMVGPGGAPAASCRAFRELAAPAAGEQFRVESFCLTPENVDPPRPQPEWSLACP